ncbi:lipid-transfer protein [Salinisphaera sp. PC39]|uniref:lipid-transfer protein n=1 Tax=Salinisphaera sp. PC39 TaxID=1304156 RepID=UPI00333FB3FA
MDVTDRTVVISGVGMTRFRRPSERARYELLGQEAVTKALTDAGLAYDAIEQVYAGWVYGDSTSGQRAVYGAGLTGVPIVNVNNNCSSGSSALYLARQAVASGAAECVLAVGFEQMPSGALDLMFPERTSPLDRHLAVADRYLDGEDGPMTLKAFAAAAREHMARDGIGPETYARIAVKARRHAAGNPNSAYREPIEVADVLEGKTFLAPLTKLQCCPPTSGAAAAVVCSSDYARRNGLDASVRILAQAMTTDFPGSFGDSAIRMVGSEMSQRAAERVYETAGLGPDDIDVCELHDCFTVNEALSYEALGFTPAGSVAQFVADGDNTYGGRVVVNPSGGLLSKGHPLGATGLAQCTELVQQLRGRAGARQVEGARIGLQHNIGLGGAAVVTLYARA